MKKFSLHFQFLTLAILIASVSSCKLHKSEAEIKANNISYQKNKIIKNFYYKIGNDDLLPLDSLRKMADGSYKVVSSPMIYFGKRKINGIIRKIGRVNDTLYYEYISDKYSFTMKYQVKSQLHYYSSLDKSSAIYKGRKYSISESTGQVIMENQKPLVITKRPKKFYFYDGGGDDEHQEMSTFWDAVMIISNGTIELMEGTNDEELIQRFQKMDKETVHIFEMGGVWPFNLIKKAK